MHRLLQPSPYADDRGRSIGRDPRTLSLDDYRAAGIEPVGVMKAIRTYCLACCGDQPGEVRKCVATSCQLWPFRMGVDVFHGQRGGAEKSDGLAAGSDSDDTSSGVPSNA